LQDSSAWPKGLKELKKESCFPSNVGLKHIGNRDIALLLRQRLRRTRLS